MKQDVLKMSFNTKKEQRHNSGTEIKESFKLFLDII